MTLGLDQGGRSQNRCWKKIREGAQKEKGKNEDKERDPKRKRESEDNGRDPKKKGKYGLFQTRVEGVNEEKINFCTDFLWYGSVYLPDILTCIFKRIKNT